MPARQRIARNESLRPGRRRARARRKFSSQGADRPPSTNGASIYSTKAPVFKHPKTELEAATQRYVDLFDFAPIAYVCFDRVGHIEEINLAATQLIEAKRDRLIGAPFALHVTKADAGLFLDHLLRCRSSHARVETELHLKKRNGEIILVHLASSPMTSSMRDGALLYQTAIVDLTERKRAEEALRESEERYRAIVSQGIAGMARSDPKGRLIFANHKLCEMLGYTETKLLQKTIQSITHRDDRAEYVRLFRRMIGEGKPYEQEKRFIRKDGSILWASMSAAPVPAHGGKTQTAVAVIIDISDRRKAQAELEEAKTFLEDRVREQTEELHAANKELKNQIKRRRGLEGQILEVSDREQQRLGQELHDGVCQNLTATAFMVRAMASRLRNHRVIKADDVEKIAELINAAATDTRNVARGLHHIDVDSAGLVDALQGLVDREIWRTPCRLKIKRTFHIEDDAAAVHLYRIAREAVINANKHAQAREITVELGRWKNGVVLSVSDDGVGMPEKSEKHRGLGFHIMDYRTRSLGGRLEIKSQKGGGTRVSCYAPGKK